MAWLERILVPVDFSPCSETALRSAAFLCDFYGAAVEVLHVIECQKPPEASDTLVCRRALKVASLVTRVSPELGSRAAIRVERRQPAAIIASRSHDRTPQTEREEGGWSWCARC